MKLWRLRNQLDNRLTRFGVWWMEVRGVLRRPDRDRHIPWLTRVAFSLADAVSVFDETD